MVTSKFTCSVYYQQERFSPNGCKSSFEANLSYDPYPFGVALPGGTVLRWPIYKCKDKKWRAQRYEGCGYYIANKTVTQLVKKNKLIIDNDKLLDPISKESAVIPKEYWKGECSRCGRCCMGEAGIQRCRYLIEGIQNSNQEEK